MPQVDCQGSVVCCCDKRCTLNAILTSTTFNVEAYDCCSKAVANRAVVSPSMSLQEPAKLFCDLFDAFSWVVVKEEQLRVAIELMCSPENSLACEPWRDTMNEYQGSFSIPCSSKMCGPPEQCFSDKYCLGEDCSERYHCF